MLSSSKIMTKISVGRVIMVESMGCNLAGKAYPRIYVRVDGKRQGDSQQP